DRARLIHQVPQRPAKGPGDAKGHRQRRVRLAALDLAEHRAADSGGGRQLLQRPAPLLAPLPDALADPARRDVADARGRSRFARGGTLLGHVSCGWNDSRRSNGSIIVKLKFTIKDPALRVWRRVWDAFRGCLECGGRRRFPFSLFGWPPTKKQGNRES